MTENGNLFVKPQEIEKRSFEIIAQELGNRSFPEGTAEVVKRVIHATADFDYAENLKFSTGAAAAAREALQAGATIVTDTNMAAAGINKKALERLGGSVRCFMAEEETAREAKARGITRAAVSMEYAAALKGPLIFAIGNAPTALIRLYELIREGKAEPAFIIGAPVGFVNVIEAKELIRTERMNFTQISDRLGYTSIHYFSRQFKKITGMTPSEYSSSIQMLSEK